MKIIVTNKSSKSRSQKQINELKKYVVYIAKQLNIYEKIPKVYLTYKDYFTGYYPKGKPLAGFFKSWNGKRVSIDLTGFWDENMTSRKEAIVHELTHAKQMIEKRLVVFKTGRTLRWNGQLNKDWKKWKDSVISSMESSEDKLNYHLKLLPWEREVNKNLNKFLNKNTNI